MNKDNIKKNDPSSVDLPTTQPLTSNQGTTIADDFNTLKSGTRGPSLLEDFLFREKIFHFDHERIPERVVHARGAGAHGIFRLADPIPQFSKAGFLSQAGAETDVFVRFSTVVGSRGSTDLARDVRGFAIKFYTSEGIFDLVGNNIPVFFIQDAINFPDLVHAVKPEERNEIPQAASAHNTFWDFASLMPETAHMVMWLMSDRAIPRSYRMMQGFGVNTYKLYNAQGESFFVKFHLKPKLGVHSVVWDEAQKISGRNPDFHRQDLWEAIENGDFPEWDLGVQILTDEQEQALDFDILDATKVIPEELIPIQYIGTLQLNRNPDNYFAETEQVAFHPGHIVPGIDFSDDPLLQGRLFSYLDTQLSRLGSSNFHELPINKPKNPTHNFRRDGAMRHNIPTEAANYNPHSAPGGCPYLSNLMSGGKGFDSVPAEMEGRKVRKRSETFGDHFSQTATFYNSQTEIGKKHIQDAFSFELGKVTREEVRSRYLGILSVVNKDLARIVADRLGLVVPDGLSKETVQTASQIFENYPALDKIKLGFTYPSLSMEYHCDFDTIKTRKIAAILSEGFDIQELKQMQSRIKAEGAMLDIISDRYGEIISATGEVVKVDYTLVTMDSVLYDALYVVGGDASQEKLATIKKAVCYVDDALKHNKAIAIGGNNNVMVLASDLRIVESDKAVVKIRTASDIEMFIQLVALHRNWQRELQNDLL